MVTSVPWQRQFPPAATRDEAVASAVRAARSSRPPARTKPTVGPPCARRPASRAAAAPRPCARRRVRRGDGRAGVRSSFDVGSSRTASAAFALRTERRLRPPRAPRRAGRRRDRGGDHAVLARRRHRVLRASPPALRRRPVGPTGGLRRVRLAARDAPRQRGLNAAVVADSCSASPARPRLPSSRVQGTGRARLADSVTYAVDGSGRAGLHRTALTSRALRRGADPPTT